MNGYITIDLTGIDIGTTNEGDPKPCKKGTFKRITESLKPHLFYGHNDVGKAMPAVFLDWRLNNEGYVQIDLYHGDSASIVTIGNDDTYEVTE